MAVKRDASIKDITDRKLLDKIILESKVCRVAMVDDNKPYVLAFNFGYLQGVLYLHTAREGKKLDVLRANPNVCVQFDTDNRLFARHEQVACSWRMAYRSVLAHGVAEFVDDYDDKVEALRILMQNYSDTDFTFNKPAVDNICIIRVPFTEITGRSFEY